MSSGIRVELKNGFGALGAATKKHVAAAVTSTAFAVEADAKVDVQAGTKTGRVYKRGNVEHQASAPGEAPATDVGDLVNSIQTNVLGGGLTAEVTVGANYGAALELGTEDGKIAPRPFLGPAMEKQETPFERRVASALDKAAREVGQ